MDRTNVNAIRLPMQYGGRSMKPYCGTPYRLLTQVGLAYAVRLRRHLTDMAMFNKVSRRDEPEEHKLLKRLKSYIFVIDRLSRYGSDFGASLREVSRFAYQVLYSVRID